MKSFSAKTTGNTYRKWSVAHHEPVNAYVEPGKARPVAVAALSRDGKRKEAVVLKARPVW